MFPKLAHFAPKVETLETGVPYAISINPADEWKAGQLPISWINRQYGVLREMTRGLKLILYPESSPTGRLHFHGTIEVYDVFNYLMFLKGLALYGTYCIKGIVPDKPDATTTGALLEEGTETEEVATTSHKWLEYCTKQSYLFIPLFDSSVLAYPLVITPPVLMGSDVIDSTKPKVRRGRTVLPSTKTSLPDNSNAKRRSGKARTPADGEREVFVDGVSVGGVWKEDPLGRTNERPSQNTPSQK